MAGLRCEQCEDFTSEEEIDDEGYCLDCQLREEERSFYTETDEHRTY